MLREWHGAVPFTQTLTHEIGGKPNLIAAITITKLCLLCFDTYLTLTLFTSRRRCDGVRFRWIAMEMCAYATWSRSRGRYIYIADVLRFLSWIYLLFYEMHFNRIPHYEFLWLWFPAHIFVFCSRSFFFHEIFRSRFRFWTFDNSIFDYQFNDFNGEKIVNGFIEITILIAVRARSRQRLPRRLAHTEWITLDN